MQIEIKNVRKKYTKKGKEVLSGISFTAESGECVGIVGLNGCGKTTLLSALAGVLPVDEGSFQVDGKNIWEEEGMIQNRIGYVPQNNPLMTDLSVKDNLLLWYTGAALDMNRELEEGVLHMLGIDRFAEKKVSELSGGMKKRLSIGCAMANAPGVLIMDEPSASLDIDCKLEIANYIEEFKKQGGIVLLATHEKGEIELCDRLYLMKNGTLQDYQYQTIEDLTLELKR